MQMHPVVSQTVHVPHDWKRPGSWREVGRPTVSDPVHRQDENSSEEKQRTDAAVRMGAKYRNDKAHSSDRLQLGRRGASMWLCKAGAVFIYPFLRLASVTLH